MMTTVGEVDEKLLERKERTTEIPVGEAVETEFFLDGELVRRDVHVKVSESFIAQARENLL
jgi:hypothetical protein